MTNTHRVLLLALVVALALAALPTPTPARVPSGPLQIHVEAVVLEEPTAVGARMVFLFNGTAILAQLIVGESDVSGVAFFAGLTDDPFFFDIPTEISYELTRVPLIEVLNIRCTGTVDRAGNGSGRCASSGEVAGGGTWAGRIDVETRSLDLTIYLQVVCPRCPR